MPDSAGLQRSPAFCMCINLKFTGENQWVKYIMWKN